MAESSEMRIERVDYGHRDVASLVEQVQQVYVERYGGRDDSPLEPGTFSPPVGCFFVGYVDDVAVATGAWRRSEVSALGAATSAEIKRMYVVPAEQRRGRARAMLAHLERSAAAYGIEAMILETGTMQPEAIALYLSSGYVAVPGFGYHRDAPESRCFAKRLGG